MHGGAGKITCHAEWMIHFGLLHWLTCGIIHLTQQWRSHIVVHWTCSWKCLSVRLHKTMNIRQFFTTNLLKIRVWSLAEAVSFQLHPHHSSGHSVNSNYGSKRKRMLRVSTGFITQRVYTFLFCTHSTSALMLQVRQLKSGYVWMFTSSIICHIICTETEAQIRFYNRGGTPVGGPQAAWSVNSCVLYCA